MHTAFFFEKEKFLANYFFHFKGHGKRSGNSRHVVLPTSMQRRTNEWFISKLLKPSFDKPNELAALFKSQNQDAITADKRNQYGYQVYPFADVVDKALSK